MGRSPEVHVEAGLAVLGTTSDTGLLCLGVWELLY